MKVYLDNAATTPLAPEVLESMMPYMTEIFGNPSSTHSFGRKAKAAMETARRTIASTINCTPGEIYFTSGGTEADNLAMHCAIYDLGCTRIITSPIEHHAVENPAQEYAKNELAELVFVKLNHDGSVDMADLERLLSTSNKKTYVSLMHANNEIANLLPLQKTAELCEKYNAVFHSDTVQSMGHYRFNVQETPVHFMSASAHKFHGPKGAGFMYINKNVKASPILIGGGQERGLRPGTENIYGIIGMAKAIELCVNSLDEHSKQISDVKQYMISQLKSTFPDIEFNGRSAEADSLYTVLNVTMPESENATMLLMLLDMEGIACSGGSACSSGAAKGSHVLEALGATRAGRASIRFSFNRFNTKEEIDFTVSKLKELCPVPVKSGGLTA